MNQEILIRHATLSDITVLSGIIRHSFRSVADRFGLTPQNCPRHPSNCEDAWIEADLQRGVDYYLLMHASQPAGCVALERSTPTTCLLERLAVLPAAQGKGFGSALVRHVFDVAGKQGFHCVRIAIIADYGELKHWYLHRGFIPQETRTFPALPFRVMFLNHHLTPTT